MKHILVLHAHTANRGDEAAVKAMVDELLCAFPEMEITISLNSDTRYPAMRSEVIQIDRMPVPRDTISKIDFVLMYLTKGRISFTRHGKQFLQLIRQADLVIHAPGGPAIGDIYFKEEFLYLMRLSIVKSLGTRYVFYAPSMGPFNSRKRERLRKKIITGAEKVVLRDPISIAYLKEFLPEVDTELAFDSALQHDIDMPSNAQKLEEYSELKDFLDKHKKTIGITITDFGWHPQYRNSGVKEKIFTAFNRFIDKRISEGYGILFIPQLYGESNDYMLMEQFMRGADSFIITDSEDRYDTYFQQYVIGNLYAIVGMRYHSNIFSAKMSTPFVSIAYEQKMTGFMERLDLMEYCLSVDDLGIDTLESKWEYLVGTYSSYKQYISDIHKMMRSDSHKSTDAVIDILNKRIKCDE